MDTSQEKTPVIPSVEPTAEHRWLERLVGEWTFEMEPAPGQPEMTGSETVRALGGIWFLAEGTHHPPEVDPHRTLMTLGFDTSRNRFVGTWVGSMMTHLWVYDGHLSEDGSKLNLDCEGPSMSGDGRMLPYRDVIEIRSDDHRILRGNVKEDDGSWREFMVTHYRRRT